MYVCITESLNCTAETNTTLYVNYISKKQQTTTNKKKQDKGLQKDVREGTAISDMGSGRL